MSNLNPTADLQQQEQDRLKKMAKIRALGFDPYGTRFENAQPLAELRALGETLPLQPGGEPDRAPHRLAGRIVLLRDMGKLMFLSLRDDTGDLQVGISKKSIPEAEWLLCKELDLGDLIGVHGCLGRTKTGELTVWARIPENPLDGQPVDEQAAWDLAEGKNADQEPPEQSAPEAGKVVPPAQNAAVVLLCKSLLPPPAKEAAGGFADTDLRYRQRYIDLYANPSVMATFRKRFTLIKFIRDFLSAPRTLAHPYGGFVEVETPMLQSIYGGAAARPFTTHHNTLDLDLFLRISPEIYLKRLLVGGLPRIFEINRNFRNEGISTKHNPEFTMMELYMAYGDYTDMMHITEGLIAGACRLLNQDQLVLEWNGRKVDFTPPWPRLHYGDLFQKHLGCDMFNPEAVRAVARQKLPTIKDAKGQEKDYAILVGELFESVVEPVIARMDRPVFVLDYPAPLCPLTRRAPNDSRIALRFEAYVCGMEIANAYTELNDPAVQEENFRQQLEGEGDETMRVVDTDFIHALKAGMPPAGGLGIGIDRMVMLLTNSASIRDVILFPLQRPEK